MRNNKKSMVMRVLKISLPALFFLFLFCAVWYVVQALQNPNVLPIKSITISADAENIPAVTLKNLVAENARGGFFSLNTEDLKNSLMNLPWVKSVDIQRVWPNQLNIKVKERQAAQLWGATGAIDQDGNLFFPDVATLPKNLPILSGPQDHAADVVNLYKTLSASLVPLSLTISNLTLSDRGSWQLQLSNGLLVILGGEDMAARFQKFAALYPKIIGDNSSNALTVDLRYPNGVAVQWKKGKPPAARPSKLQAQP